VVTATAHGATLAELLRESAAVCARALDACVDARQTERPYFSALMLAAAGLERAADAHRGDPSREVSLLIASTLAEEAAAALREADDDTLREAADAAERAAYVCRAASMRSAASSSAASAGSPPRA
jgi:hypothetical protein